MFLPDYDRPYPQYDQGPAEAWTKSFSWETGYQSWYEVDEVKRPGRVIQFRSWLGDALIALGYRLKAPETVSARIVVDRPPFSTNGTSS